MLPVKSRSCVLVAARGLKNPVSTPFGITLTWSRIGWYNNSRSCALMIA